jgi:hypothetical protein
MSGNLSIRIASRRFKIARDVERTLKVKKPANPPGQYLEKGAPS